MVVVFPAPLGPRNPNTEPTGTSKLRPSTARKVPNVRVRPSARNAISVILGRFGSRLSHAFHLAADHRQSPRRRTPVFRLESGHRHFEMTDNQLGPRRDWRVDSTRGSLAGSRAQEREYHAVERNRLLEVGEVTRPLEQDGAGSRHLCFE